MVYHNVLSLNDILLGKCSMGWLNFFPIIFNDSNEVGILSIG